MSTKTITAIAGALLLTLTAFAMPAASETQPDQEIDPDTSTPACLQIYFEWKVGPVTVTGGCTSEGGISIDEDWSPSDELSPDAEIPDELSTTADLKEDLGCALKDADNASEIFWCFFGPPGP